MAVVKEIFDGELLIKEVEKRPPLYDTSLREYTDRVYKGKLWEEVFQAVVNNWYKLSANDKLVKGKDVMKRWKAIRDCFRREATFQKRGETLMRNGQKRRPYVFFNLLTFLQPGLEKLDQTQYVFNSASDEYEENSVDPLNLDPPPASPPPPVLTPSVPPPAQIIISNTTKRSSPPPPQCTPRIPKKPPSSSFESALLDLLQENNKKSEEMDDDKAFLMSILPALRNFKEEEKFTVRMEIMKTIERIRDKVPVQSPQPPPQPCLPLFYTINVPTNMQQLPPQNTNDKLEDNAHISSDKTQTEEKLVSSNKAKTVVNGVKRSKFSKKNRLQKKTGVKRRRSSISEGSLVIDDDCDIVEV